MCTRADEDRRVRHRRRAGLFVGWLYAHLQRFVNPTPFGINQGIENLFMAVVGGAVSVWGAVLGATLVTLLKTWLQDLLPKLLGEAGQFEIIVFGVLLVLLLQYAREGLLPYLQRFCLAEAALAGGGGPPAASQHAGCWHPVLEVDTARKTFGGLVPSTMCRLTSRPVKWSG